MVWLTHILIPRREVRQLGLYNNDRWHKFAWLCFPCDPTAKRDFLTRLDVGIRDTRLYILSVREPVRPEACRDEWWASTEVNPTFLNHERYRFTLRANPTKKITNLDAAGQQKKNSRKVALITREEQQAWLERKAQQGGFVIDDSAPLIISPCSAYSFYRDNQRISHIGTDFSGVLRVTDQNQFYETFLHGIGSSRAFGFGMLILQYMV